MATSSYSTERNRFWQEALAIVLCGVSLLILLALLSFDQQDVAFQTTNPNKTVSNFIGPVGAYLGWGLYMALGVGAYLVPLTLLGVAALLAWKPFEQAGIKALLAFCLIVSGASLIQLGHPILGFLLRNPLQTPNSIPNFLGGMVGYFLNDQLLAFYMGSVGSALLLGMIYILSFVLLFEINPWQMVKEAYFNYLEWREQRELDMLEGADAGEILAYKKKLLEKEQRQLQKQLAQRGNSSPDPKPSLSERPEPQIIDTTAKKAAEAAEREPKPEKKPRIHLDNPKPAEPVDEPLPLPKKRPLAAPATPSDYHLPTLDLLTANVREPKMVSNEEELREQQQQLIDTLREFDVEVSAGDITRGATITRFEVFPAPGIRVERIVSLKNNIARAMKAEKINILAPIPGKDTVGIEVANTKKVMIMLRDLFESPDWAGSRLRIPIAIGKDIYGKVIIDDLAEMPHLLIGGQTGAGKSVCINCILLSLLYRFTPDDLRIILVDPKVVELASYNDMPHLVFPVLTDSKKVLGALRYVINEMEKRYKIMAKAGVRNITAYNTRKKEVPEKQMDLLATPPEEEEPAKEDDIEMPDHLPYYVVIIDEMADLMQTTAPEVEDAIARLSAKARAAGIHVILATQTPRATVVTGVIKANVPGRIAFNVSSSLDSRVILDENGAENLLGKGDLLYLRPGTSKLTRAQGAYVSEEEVTRVVSFIKSQRPPSYGAASMAKIENDSMGDDEISEEDEGLIRRCFEVIRQEKRASTSLFQRRLRIGYGTAAWAMDQLEARGIVGPKDGAKDREILIDLDKGLPPSPTRNE